MQLTQDERYASCENKSRRDRRCDCVGHRRETLGAISCLQCRTNRNPSVSTHDQIVSSREAVGSTPSKSRGDLKDGFVTVEKVEPGQGVVGVTVGQQLESGFVNVVQRIRTSSIEASLSCSVTRQAERDQVNCVLGEQGKEGNEKRIKRTADVT